MSGGLDSSVAAWILSRQERPVIGLSMLLWDRSDENVHGRCCGSLDLGDARRVAHQIGIRHYTLRLDQEFRRHVVDPFVESYLEGRTPSPCIACNTWIKFNQFLDHSRELGAERIATGHYARILPGPDGPELHQALDSDKDQSYYLFELTQEQLSSSLFPLGEMTKAQARSWARKASLLVAEKGESMEICFVSHGVQRFLEEQVQTSPGRFRQGGRGPSEVVDSQGRTLGRAAPYYRYTVGQRRGLGLAAAEPLYVLNVDAGANRVVVGNARECQSRGLLGERVHWIGPPPDGELRATVRIRSRHPGVRARITPRPQDQVEVEFDEAQSAVAPGQAAVFYRKSQVLGGCWIHSSLN